MFGSTKYFLEEPPPGRLPRYTVFAMLSCVWGDSEDGISYLAAVWFWRELPANLPGLLAEKIAAIDWEKHAI